jgi:hypothetical protein
MTAAATLYLIIGTGVAIWVAYDSGFDHGHEGDRRRAFAAAFAFAAVALLWLPIAVVAWLLPEDGW